MIRVIVADDHEIFREGLLRMFASTSHIQVAGDAGDGEKTLRLILQEKPDVAVIDISMPGMDGFHLIERLKESDHTETRIIFLTMHKDPSLAARAMRLGAAGYVLKDDTFKDLIYAIDTVLAGRKFISSTISEKMISEQPGETHEKLLLLTGREREVLRHIAMGRKNKEIAGELFISVKTVDSHRTSIMQKLDLHSVADLVRYALRSGLL